MDITLYIAERGDFWSLYTRFDGADGGDAINIELYRGTFADCSDWAKNTGFVFQYAEPEGRWVSRQGYDVTDDIAEDIADSV